MANSPENGNFINKTASKVMGEFDNGPRAAEATVNLYHRANAFDMGQNNLPLAEAIERYGDSQAIRDAHADGKNFGGLEAHDRARIQQKYSK